MKKLVLIVAAFLGLSAGAASATCTGPAVMHDFPGTAFNMSLATAPDGNCASNNAITTWGGVSLGAPSNYGTSPGAVAVIGVNSFVTNFPSTFPLNATPSLANGNGVVPTQGGSVLSAANGLYANILQGNAVNSLTNPFFMSPATGSVWPISVASLPLAPLAATTTNQTSQITQETATANALGTTADAPATLPASTTPATGISVWKAIANALNSLLSAATTPLDNTSVPINISTATTTQLVALSGSTQVRITSWDVIAGGTGTFQLVYGTGTACATGQNPLTGAYPLTAQAGEAKGSGIGTILKTPAGQAVCAVTVGAVQYSGSLSFQQF